MRSIAEFTVRAFTGIERRLIRKFPFSVKSFGSAYSKSLEDNLMRFSLFELNSSYEYLDVSTNTRRLVGHSSRNLIELEHVLVDLYYGNVFTHSKELVTESTIWPNSFISSHVMPVPIAARHVDTGLYGDVFLASNSFYHFLIEDLPDLLKLNDMAPEIRVLIWDCSPKYVAQALSLAGIKFSTAQRFVSLDSVRIIEKSKVVAPSQSSVSVLKNFLPQASKFSPPTQRVYVSRLGEDRSPCYERELIRMLEASGNWIVIKLGTLSFEEQLEQARSAKVWVGVHGAGLSWIPMLDPTAVIIEIGPAKMDCFQQLAFLSGITFFRIDGEVGKIDSAIQTYEAIYSILQSSNLEL
jgi:hypothetical protein